MNYAQKTQHPELFSRVYWGAFRDKGDPLIFKNRNRFVKDFNITGVLPLSGSRKLYMRHIHYLLQSSCADHTEKYVNKDGLAVLITSPYGDLSCKKFVVLEEEGWTQMYPLYSQDAITYFKIVPKNLNEHPQFVAEFMEGALESHWVLRPDGEGNAYRVIADSGVVEMKVGWLYGFYTRFMQQKRHQPKPLARPKFTALVLEWRDGIQKVEVRSEDRKAWRNARTGEKVLSIPINLFAALNE